MHRFEYVLKSEWFPVKQELLNIIQKLQEQVRDRFTFQYHFVGSSQRNMITRDRNTNVGFDFDVNLEVNDPNEQYSPKQIRDILRNGLDNITHPCHSVSNDIHHPSIFSYDHSGGSTIIVGGVGIHSLIGSYPHRQYTPCDYFCGLDRGVNEGYDYAEDSTRVLTIKVKDQKNARILHSCDFCIVRQSDDGRQQYIHYNKKQNNYSWKYQPEGFGQLPKKIDFCKKNKRLWSDVRNLYLDKKNTNTDEHKKSRSIFAETIHQVCQQNGYYD